MTRSSAREQALPLGVDLLQLAAAPLLGDEHDEVAEDLGRPREHVAERLALRRRLDLRVPQELAQVGATSIAPTNAENSSANPVELLRVLGRLEQRLGVDAVRDAP